MQIKIGTLIVQQIQQCIHKILASQFPITSSYRLQSTLYLEESYYFNERRIGVDMRDTFDNQIMVEIMSVKLIVRNANYDPIVVFHFGCGLYCNYMSCNMVHCSEFI